MSEFANSSQPKPGELRAALFPKTIFPILALLIITIGSAFRFYHLGLRSLWWDEAVTANISRGTFAEVLQKTRGVSAPVVHPYLLYFVERVARGPVAVRIPSAVASILAILIILAMVRAKVSPYAALIASTIFAISATQIRYAQEVREYSLSVLWATCLIYCLLRWEGVGPRSRHPSWLYGLLFLAPLVQYGLVFFGFAILCTIILRIILAHEDSYRISHVLMGWMFLAAGSLLSYLLTARYQFHSGGTQWYLASNYYNPNASSLAHYLSLNLMGLLAFVIPGRVCVLCSALVVTIFCLVQFSTRKFETITLLALTSVLIVVCAAIARMYPFGGIRQCLFLAPALVLLVGVAFAEFLNRLKGHLQAAAFVGLLALIFVSLYRDVRRESPYAEFEDTQSILRELNKSTGPNDQIWVNHDAVEPLEFYLEGNDHRFIYGKFHGNDPQEYVPELLASINPHRDRFWLVFSHLEQPSDRLEEQLIVKSLKQDWDVRCVIAPTNTALFMASRKAIPPLQGGS